MKWLFAPTLFLVLCSCATPKPVFVKDAKYRRAGLAKVNQDTEICYGKADKENNNPTKRDKRQKDALVSGAVVGGLFGLAGGASSGNSLSGAVGGAAGGGATGYATGGNMPEHEKRYVVTSCLERKGYHVSRWE